MGEWWEERTLQEKVAMVIGMVILGIGALFLFGLIVMWLWNWLMPDIFGLPEIDYWQGWGLLLLSCILFKGVGSGSNDSGRSDRKRKRKLRGYMDEGATAEGTGGTGRSWADDKASGDSGYPDDSDDRGPGEPAPDDVAAAGDDTPPSHDEESDR